LPSRDGKQLAARFANRVAADASGLTLIPLNMSEPVLVVRGKDAKHGLGFSPHGAGRNFSRSEHKRRMKGKTPDQLLKEETEGLDIRFHAGGVDSSELPSSCKNADGVVAQIKTMGWPKSKTTLILMGALWPGTSHHSGQRKRNRRGRDAFPRYLISQLKLMICSEWHPECAHFSVFP
jgi:hypothetical protein